MVMFYDRGRLVGHLYLGGTLMRCVTHWLDSSSDNAGHWQSSVALEVPLGRVST